MMFQDRPHWEFLENQATSDGICRTKSMSSKSLIILYQNLLNKWLRLSSWRCSHDGEKSELLPKKSVLGVLAMKIHLKSQFSKFCFPHESLQAKRKNSMQED